MVRAFIDELPEDDECPLFRWSGRFRCSLDEGQARESGSLHGALAWAREHARHVAVDFEDERHHARAASRCAGFDDVEMSADGLDEGLADIEEQTRAHEGEVGWTTSHPLAYEVRAASFASTRRQVVERAVQIAADAIEPEIGAGVWRRTTGRPMYLAWRVSADTRPAGAPPLGPPPL